MASALTPPGQPGPMGKDEFKSASTPNLVTFKTAGIDPPTSLYVQRDDQLLMVAISQSTPTLTITARLWLATEGRIITLQQTLALTAGDSPKNVQIPLAEGYLLSVVVTSSAGTLPGATLVSVFINRGIATNTPSTPGAVLISDYVQGNSGCSWPNGRISKPGDTQGQRVVFAPANPSAGADITFPANAQELWELELFTATLTTSAAAGNRNVQLILDGSGTPYYVSTANASVPPSTTATVCGSQINQTSTLVATTVFVVIPPRNLLTGVLDRIRTLTANIGVADQWSNILITVRNWELF